jgi:hypothetical protein
MTSKRASKGLHKDALKQAKYRASTRQWTFDYFDAGMRPVYVARTLHIDQATAFRYFEQWKKLPPFFKYKYKVAKQCFRKLGYRNRKKIARILAKELGTSVKEVSVHMQKPWAVRQIVSGQWRQWPVSKVGGRRRDNFNSLLGKVRQLTYQREVKYIIEMAMNQDIDPLEGERGLDLMSEDNES